MQARRPHSSKKPAEPGLLFELKQGRMGTVMVIFCAFLIRYFFAASTNPPLQGDAGHYVAIANNLLQQGFFGVDDHPDSLRPPVYPILLALVSAIIDGGHVGMMSIQWINYISDFCSIVLLLAFASRLGLNQSMPGVLLVALSPFWFGNINSGVTEPLSLSFLFAFINRWTKPVPHERDGIMAGIYLGLLTLTRSMFLLFPFAILAFHLGWKRFKPKKTSHWTPDRRFALVFLMACYVLPISWGFRNLATMGQFQVAQREIGISMAWLTTQIPMMDWREPGMSERYFSLPLIRELESGDRKDIARGNAIIDRMRAETFEFVLNHPIQYLGFVWQKFWRLWVTGWWNPYSYLTVDRRYSPIYIWIFCVPVLFLGSIGMISQWRRHFSGELQGAPIDDIRLRLLAIQTITVFYVSAVTAPMIVDSRYALASYVLFGLWIGHGWSVLTRR